ncbi:MAG: phosphoribosylformylglycinamidine synthase I [Chloroflexota bacterium]
MTLYDGRAHGGTAPRALVVRAPGINCDRETALACAAAGAATEIVSLNELSAAPERLFSSGLLVLPGGFSHGDYLGAGTLLAAQLRAALGPVLERFVDDGGLVLGICNGFQVLARLGLLPDVALAPNEHAHFECRWVTLRATPQSPCVFTRGLTLLSLPVAHGEGRVVPRDPAALARLEARGCIALRYATAGGAPAVAYPANPNGSAGAIAGLCNTRGTVLGLMPHPERASRPDQGLLGLRLFQNAVDYLREREPSHAR